MTLRSLAAAHLVRRSRLSALVELALWAGAPAAGCIDPRADYEDFAGRPVLQAEAGAPDVPLTACQELLKGDPSGSYFVSCRPVTTQSPFGLAVQLTTAAALDGGTDLALSFQTLPAGATRLSDKTGDPVSLAGSAIADDCTFVQSIGTFVLPADNPLMFEIVADEVVVRGKLQNLGSACGELDGTVTTPPIGLSLNGDGDVCIFRRVAEDAPLPAVTDYICDPNELPPMSCLHPEVSQGWSARIEPQASLRTKGDMHDR